MPIFKFLFLFLFCPVNTKSYSSVAHKGFQAVVLFVLTEVAFDSGVFLIFHSLNCDQYQTLKAACSEEGLCTSWLIVCLFFIFIFE